MKIFLQLSFFNIRKRQKRKMNRWEISVKDLLFPICAHPNICIYCKWNNFLFSLEHVKVRWNFFFDLLSKNVEWKILFISPLFLFRHCRHRVMEIRPQAHYQLHWVARMQESICHAKHTIICHLQKHSKMAGN